MTKLHELSQLGQSVWYDNIRRALLENGELQELVGAGVTGVTRTAFVPSVWSRS